MKNWIIAGLIALSPFIVVALMIFGIAFAPEVSAVIFGVVIALLLIAGIAGMTISIKEDLDRKYGRN